MTLKLTEDYGLWAVMITYDGDADVLPRCLDSLTSAGIKAVVVDTTKSGPSEAIKAICKDHEAVYDHDEWHDDFASSRNASLAIAKSTAGAKFALQIDSDETLVVGNPNLVVQIFDAIVREGGDLLAIPMDSEDEFGNRRYMLQRIFSLHHNKCFFKGAIHERIEISNSTGAVIVSASPVGKEAEPLLLRHDGHSEENAVGKDKHARNQACALNELSKDPKDPYVLSSIAVCLLGTEHMDTSLEAFSKALIVCEKIRFDKCVEVPFSVVYNMMKLPEHLISVGRLAEAWMFLNRLRRVQQGMRELVTLQAMILISEKNEPQAIEMLHQNLLHRGLKTSMPGCCGWRDMLLMSSAYLQILDFEQGLSFLAAAWEAAENDAGRKLVESDMRLFLPTVGVKAYVGNGKAEIKGNMKLPPKEATEKMMEEAIVRVGKSGITSRIEDMINNLKPLVSSLKTVIEKDVI